ncbi:hypothetical protein F2Q69_00011378 [Brassica cretica]|uniref:Uncharacterized protein n=1 Tax=Brassica cretica TaxID=69181 RepID=A0A8S9R4Q8_BRACR|nr:hypothetical protein F2Q69_00011378 [Brassica cretica]
MVASSPMRSNIVGSTPIRSNYRSTLMRSNLAGRLILTESELVPSSSEVANKKAKERSQANDTESLILSEWSLEDDRNIEGLRSKLERWRTELPPLYDLGSSHQSSDVVREIVPVSANGGGGKSSRRKAPTVKKKKKHNRRHTEGGNSLFSCFSNLCGVECTFVCGAGSDHDGSKKKDLDKTFTCLESGPFDEWALFWTAQINLSSISLLPPTCAFFASVSSMADHIMVIAGEWNMSDDGSWTFSIDKHHMSTIVSSMADHVMVIAGEWKMSDDGSWTFSIDKHHMSRIVSLAPTTTLLDMEKNVLKEYFPNIEALPSAYLSYWPPNTKELATGISTPRSC